MSLSLHVRVVGGLFTGSLLDRIAAGDPRLPGTTPESYHQETAAELNQAIHRSWLVLTGRWASFRMARNALPEGDRATALTRDKWLLPLFTELGYGRLPAERPVELDGRSFPVSHRWAHTPIHLIGAGDSLDRPPEKALGAPSPHGLVQDLLNSAEDRLWGLLSNGLQLRLLRDHRALTRQAFVEFDVESIFDEEAYSAFRVLWLLCHQSRVEGEKASDCWLQRWFQVLRDDGVPAMDRMREGVELALVHLGNGFLRHRDNAALVTRLSAGDLSPQDCYRQLLRLAYRLIFLLVAERRGLLLDPAATPEARDRYARIYSTDRLRLLATRRRGGPHADAWIALRLVMRHLDRGCPGIALPGLGSFLWRTEALPDLDPCSISNEDLFAAVRALCEIQDGPVRRPVDWASVQSDELGSIYEALMERVPRVNLATPSFELTNAGGNERKTTGSYYTPSSLVDCLLDSALDPVLDEVCARPNAEAAILDLSVVDPACGSGHFLVAAARRIAVRLARVRTGGLEPSPPEVQHALRDVVSRCIYGVDINPMAVELCKVSLWMEALEPGKPLSFLDAHIRCGNALIGTTPELMGKGIPDEAWEVIEGDDKDVARRLKKANRGGAQGGLFGAGSGAVSVDIQRTAAATLDQVERWTDSTRSAVEEKERAFLEAEASEPVRAARLLADLWCAAFVWPKVPGDGESFAPTKGVWDRVKGSPLRMPGRMQEIAEGLRERYGFFHWGLGFPTPTARGGFDVVLGNPPWERVKLQEQEFFASRSPVIAGAANAAARKRMIAALPTEDAALWLAWCEASREAEGQSHLVRASGRYPLCGKGDVNTYALFAEHNRAILGPKGRAGFIVPTGIATDDTTKEYFGALMETQSLAAFYGFENEAKIFVGIDHRVNFCLIVLSAIRVARPRFSAFVRGPAALTDPGRVYELTSADIELLNPNTGTCPVFRSRRDADINLALYRRSGVLWNEAESDGNRWGLRFMRMLDMANDSGLFRTRAQMEASGQALQSGRFDGPAGPHVPLIEAKMVYHFNHRFGDFALLEQGEREHILPQVGDEDLGRSDFVTTPRYWVSEMEVEASIGPEWRMGWFLGWRDVTDARSSARTVIASLVPRVASGDTLLLALPDAAPALVAALYANLCAFALDYAARQKVGGTHLKYHVFKQLPILPPNTYAAPAPWSLTESLQAFLLPRVLELTYTAWDLAPFAQDLGHDGPPFRWDPARRPLLRAELDAAFFHLYALDRDDTAYILDTFPIVRRNDEKAHGEYRTKRLILTAYDAMADATATGIPYGTPLDPPPGDAAMRHPARGVA